MSSTAMPGEEDESAPSQAPSSTTICEEEDDDESERPQKPASWDYWRGVLGGAKFAVAPMVDQSELAWRILSRRHGAQLTFTPMLHASVFARDPAYRRESIQLHPSDRPLIVQFCANDPDILLAAAELLPEDGVDGVDLNLGCPQLIAKRGFYGAYLQEREHWPRVRRLISILHRRYRLPVSAKIRVLPDPEETLEYARFLQDSGVQLLTVHGRTRDQKGSLTGIADWEQIKAVKAALSIPVFANGNMEYHEDLERCFSETGVDGVMMAEGNLHNPAITEVDLHPIWALAEEYLSLCRAHPAPVSFVRGHLFKLFHHPFTKHPLLREQCASANSVDDLASMVAEMRGKYEEEHQRWEAEGRPEKKGRAEGELRYPIWIAQPYRRPKSGDPTRPVVAVAGEAAEAAERKQAAKRALEERAEEAGLSKRRLRKLLKCRAELPTSEAILKALAKDRPVYVPCACGNPIAGDCVHRLCRRCCFAEATKRPATCPQHNFYFHPEHPRPHKAAHTHTPANTSS